MFLQGPNAQEKNVDCFVFDFNFCGHFFKYQQHPQTF